MRKLPILIIAALLLLSLCACAANTNSTHEVTVNGTAYTVDTQNKTITDGEYTYEYSVSGNETVITYPNGSSWWYQTDDDGGGHGGWSDDYDETRYAAGDTLQTVLVTGTQLSRSRSKDVMLIIALLGIGAINLTSPHTLWSMRPGGRHKNAEPSTLFLTLNRIGGAATIAFGVILILK